nr:glycine-rich cell wall structural protein 1.0-like [Leptinotarsa decemlineata]
MKVVQVILLFVLFFILSTAFGIIRNKDETLIGEEDRRGAEKLEEPKKVDEAKAGSAVRSVWAVGQIDKKQLDYHHGDYAGGYGAAGPDNLGYAGVTPVGLHGYNTRPHQGGNYEHGQDDYGHGYPSGGSGLKYDHGGGGVEAYGHSDGGIGYGHSGGGVEFGHSGSGVGYGHSGSGVGYGHIGEGNNVEYDGGATDCRHTGGGIDYGYGHYGVIGHEYTGGGLNYGHSGGGVAHGYGGGSYGGSGLGGIFGKKLPLKKLLLPIAGLALLGAAAALSTNPVLLHLGTISGRKRRSISKKSSGKIYPGNPYVTPIRL